ncbi:AAA lid [Gracilaria domingensis]|nr:AAA lid [Gracilaria domingensis]
MQNNQELALPGRPDAFSKLLTYPYVYCISDRVKDKVLFPFEGYDGTIDETLHAICNGNSVLLVGEPGIGKRSLSLGLARRLASLKEDSGNPIYTRTVYTLSLGNYFWSGGSEDAQQMQRNISEVFSHVERAGPEHIVLCIDDVDILGFVDRIVNERTKSNTEQNPISLENMLRFLLFDKKVICLCTCIRSAYKRLIESDTYYDEKFTKSFRVIHMKPPNVPTSLRVLAAHKDRIEKERNVALSNDAISAAVICADRYITHRALPEKAIDVLSEACNIARSIRSKSCEGHDDPDITVSVEQRDVEHLIYNWCGVTVQQLGDYVSAVNTGS